MTDLLDRLFAAVHEARDRSPSVSRTSKLFRDGVQKMAKKLVEEAIEVGLDAVQMNRESVILESADVLYHLAVIWAECGVSPADVMGEIDRRERVYGIAEKLPKQASVAQIRRMAPWAARRRAPDWSVRARSEGDALGGGRSTLPTNSRPLRPSAKQIQTNRSEHDWVLAAVHG